MNSILCIGSCCNPQKNGFSGQAVMFDGVVSHLITKSLYAKMMASENPTGGRVLCLNDRVEQIY